jgi:hypothetical protein
MMKLIDTLEGKGTGISPTGKTPVRYRLQICEKQIPVGGGQTIPGLKNIKGWIEPFFGTFGDTLTLELKDASTVQFFFVDTKGTVQTSGGIQQPVAKHAG